MFLIFASNIIHTNSSSSCCCCCSSSYSWVLGCSLTSHVISTAFYSGHEKSDKFGSAALISAWGSFMCRKSTTWDQRLFFPSEGSHIQDFSTQKNPSSPAGLNAQTLDPVVSMITTGPQGSTLSDFNGGCIQIPPVDEGAPMESGGSIPELQLDCAAYIRDGTERASNLMFLPESASGHRYSARTSIDSGRRIKNK